MKISCKLFDLLSLQELYDIMVLRQEVFVVEQNCPYLDADGKDQLGHHVMFYEENQLVAYTRLLPMGTSYKEYASIGRVVNSDRVRGRGIGKKLMEVSIEKIQEVYKNQPIKISAQVYLLKFYSDLGFLETGERYLEDGIPHMGMVLNKQ